MSLRPFALAIAFGLAACMAPPTQAQRATDAARELNLATRFSRMDLALGGTSKGAQQAFLERRAEWGKNIRIVDIELAGLAMSDETHATIQVDVSWVRVNDDTLRVTRIMQAWLDDGGWHLTREQRMAGEIGLFGEPVNLTPATPHDVQFQSVTIR
jgi:hypothetical protein